MSTSLVRSMSMIDPNLGLSNRHRQALGVQQLAASFVMSALSFAILIGWITLVSIIDNGYTKFQLQLKFFMRHQARFPIHFYHKIARESFEQEIDEFFIIKI